MASFFPLFIQTRILTTILIFFFSVLLDLRRVVHSSSTAPDFMWDWSSQTKYEGSFIGDTFVARRADDPTVVVDTYTLEPTRIIDCPKQKKQQVVTTSLKQEVAAGVQNAESCQSDANTNDNDVENINVDLNVNVNMNVNMINHDQGPLSNGGGVSSRAAAAGISGSSG